MAVDRLQQLTRLMFTRFLGLRLLEADPDRICAEMTVTEDLCTTGGTVHGGALMTMADFLGAAGTVLNLPPGANTATLESKTNFISGARVGQKVIGVCEPLHRGKRTQVWRTTISREDGSTVAVVTQTQMVLEGPKGPQETLAGLFAGKPPEEQKALLAALDRGGAAVYRALAASEHDAASREALLKAAEREEQNAELLEQQAKGATPGP